ncbi:MAG TPA: peptidylprolyl isomerase [Candidatus Saccharimonadales bacterium]|nr:peptidylprolyl isomerase [Candidatus Saccharimonadales bacterium]
MSKKTNGKRRLLKNRIRVPQRVRNMRLPKVSLRGRTAESDAKLHEAIQNLPRITNETVAEHREEVLSSARKYIYPLSHSKRRVVSITVSLLAVAVVVFLAYCLTALYKFQSTNTFVYGVTQVIPFPVARAGSSFVSYESYLFELRHTMHYYENEAQPRENFGNPAYKQHLQQLKKAAMNQVIQDAYVKKLASQHHISVSNQEVNNEVALVRSENRLGSNDQVFRDVLSEFWGWTPADFKRELKSQLLAQKVATVLDTQTAARAQDALHKLNTGADFAALAKQVSDDTSTRDNGGAYGIAIDKSNRDIAPQVVDALFAMNPGQHSGVIDTGYTLEIVKLLDVQGDKVHAAHIAFNIKPIDQFVKPLEAQKPVHKYISVQ